MNRNTFSGLAGVIGIGVLIAVSQSIVLPGPAEGQAGTKEAPAQAVQNGQFRGQVVAPDPVPFSGVADLSPTFGAFVFCDDSGGRVRWAVLTSPAMSQKRWTPPLPYGYPQPAMPTGEFGIGVLDAERKTAFDDGQILAFGGFDRLTGRPWRGTIRIDEILPDIVVGSINATSEDLQGGSTSGPLRLEAAFRARIRAASGLAGLPHSNPRLVKTCADVLPRTY